MNKRFVIRLRRHREGIGTYDLWYEGRIHTALQGLTHSWDASVDCSQRFWTVAEAQAELDKEKLTIYGNVQIIEVTLRPVEDA